MMIDNPQFDFDTAHWILSRRSQIQQDLLLLCEFLTKNSKALSGDHKLWYACDTSIGVAFSLWRAVFLVDVSQGRANALSHAEEFLVRLVRDNTITFQQDRDTREWTVGYYLNSAACRLYVILDLLSELSDSTRQSRIRDICGLGTNIRDPKDVWNALYEFHSDILLRLSIKMK
jgi:hypothetical protein